jgi:hypothetical protein
MASPGSVLGGLGVGCGIVTAGAAGVEGIAVVVTGAGAAGTGAGGGSAAAAVGAFQASVSAASEEAGALPSFILRVSTTPTRPRNEQATTMPTLVSCVIVSPPLLPPC